MTAVMKGIRILEVAEHMFVPAASAVLADWGAEVIKVEPVERGDAMRGLARTGVLNLGDGVHALFEHANRGKQSLALDLNTEGGREVLYKLAAVCDVFLTNKLPRVCKDLQIEVEDIRRHNPNIVYVRGTGYGPEGPDANRGGYDILGYWCRSSVASGVHPPDLDAFLAQPGPGYGDSIGAMTIAGGISAALLHRERTGEATLVDVSLLSTGMWAMGAGIALSMQLGGPWKAAPLSSTGAFNPLTKAYRTKDGRWLMLSCLQAFKYWGEFCRLMGRPEMADDPRFATHEDLSANATDAVAMATEEIGKRDAAECDAILRQFSGQWAFMQDTMEVLEDPQVKANNYMVRTQTADGKPFSLVAPPVQFDGAPGATKHGPDFNEHGDQILTDLLGYDMDTVLDLKIKGAVG